MRRMRTKRARRKKSALAALRGICRRLPGSVEAAAWVGRRWKVRGQTFAHLLEIEDGWPPAYARAAGTDGPVTIVTFRSSGFLYDALRTHGRPYFACAWGTRWRTKVIGMILDDDTYWPEVALVVTESHRLLAKQKS
jgi:hypothetical protein